MLDVEIQILDPGLRSAVGDLELHWPDFRPLRAMLALRLGVERKAASLGLVRPRPRDIDSLEVRVCTLSTQSTHVGLHDEQSVLNGLSTWNIDQHNLARPHQVEPLAINILQVRVASGGC
eukprot:9202576-Pyramimonas_sp.AAC.1